MKKRALLLLPVCSLLVVCLFFEAVLFVNRDTI